jgi:hypothetical protein
MNFHCRKLNSLVSVHPPTTAMPGVRLTVRPCTFLATKVLSRVFLMCRAIPWMASSQEISSQRSEPGRRTLGVRIRFGLSMSCLSVAPFRAERAAVGGAVRIPFDVHDRRRDVLRFVAQGVDDHPARYRAVRTDASRLGGPRDLELPHLRARARHVEPDPDSRARDRRALQERPPPHGTSASPGLS